MMPQMVQLKKANASPPDRSDGSIKKSQRVKTHSDDNPRLPGRGFCFCFLNGTFLNKQVFCRCFEKMDPKCHPYFELLVKMASWTLSHFGWYPKCPKWSSQSRPVAHFIPKSQITDWINHPYF